MGKAPSEVRSSRPVSLGSRSLFSMENISDGMVVGILRMDMDIPLECTYDNSSLRTVNELAFDILLLELPHELIPGLN